MSIHSIVFMNTSVDISIQETNSTSLAGTFRHPDQRGRMEAAVAALSPSQTRPAGGGDRPLRMRVATELDPTMRDLIVATAKGFVSVDGMTRRHHGRLPKTMLIPESNELLKAMLETEEACSDDCPDGLAEMGTQGKISSARFLLPPQGEEKTM